MNAEAVAAVAENARSIGPAIWRVQPELKSTVDAATVRAQAAQAVHLGQIAYGEQGSI